MLHEICTGLSPGHLSVRAGDSSRWSEEIVKKNKQKNTWICAFQCDNDNDDDMPVYFSDESASSAVRTTTVIKKLQIKLSISPSQTILTSAL